MDEKKTKTLFVILGLVLTLPLLQQITGIVHEKSLKGAVEKPIQPTLNNKDWFDGSFQSSFENYINACFGFRNSFIRLNNQLAYSISHKAKANGVIIGKENCLFEENYIKSYYGRDFVGEDSINHVVERLRLLQTLLKTKGIDLVLVLNPGKASFFPELIPDDLKSEKQLSNYQYYAQKAREKKLNVLDLNALFLQLKQKSPYPLFSKCGIHWTYYCETLAEDTLIKYLGALQNVATPTIRISSIYWDEGSLFRDADIKEGMNLIDGPDCEQLAYPIYQVIDNNRTLLNCITISDSFYWGIYGRDDIKKLFRENQFWYYYSELYSTAWTQTKTPQEINLKAEIEKQNVIVIMATEATLPKLGWGFIEDALRVLQIP